MEPIYRKVFIKSEADLPKKRGEYYFFHRIGESILRHICYCHKTDDMELLPKAYMDNYDWYLQPVELPSGEELEKWKQIEHDFIVWDKKGNFNASQRQILNWFKVRFNSLNLINKLPTNEEIHFAGMNHYDYRIVDDGKTKEKIIRFANIWREGAKWMREKLINK